METQHIYMDNYKVFSSDIDPEDARGSIYLTSYTPEDDEDLEAFVKLIQSVIDTTLITLNDDADKVKHTIINTKKDKSIN